MKEIVLRWKFNEYNTNKDGVLNSVEEFGFHNELREIFGCLTFRQYLKELFDQDNDNAITPQEWFTFFGLSLQGTGIIIIMSSNSQLTMAQKTKLANMTLYSL